jgi:predicted dehydrogenase
VKELRVAVIGAGRLGGFHAQKLSAMPSVRLAAVVDPLATQRDRVAAACNTESLSDYQSLFGDIDAAVIAAPTRLHHAVGMEFLDRGIHVLMEKPLAATTAEADELVEAARRRNVVLQVGHVERFNPALTAALPHLRNPKYIEATRTSAFSFRSTDVGVVLDLMIHDLDLVLWMVHSPLKRVDAMGFSVLGGYEDVANARLEFRSGCVAVLSASRVSYEAIRRLQAWSPRGFASVDFAKLTTSVVRPSETLLQRRFQVDSLSPEEVEHYRKHLADEHLPRTVLSFDNVDAIALEDQDFVESILAPRAPRVTGQQARDAVAVAEEILARIGSHAWDDQPDGLVGPLAIPAPHVVPAPHFNRTPLASPMERRQAG